MRHLAPTIVAAAAALALAGCVSPQGPLADDYGAAVRQNTMAQIADPDAVYAREVEPASSGRRAAAAADRYQRGRVIRPVAQGTSSISGSSGGAAAGAAASGGQ